VTPPLYLPTTELVSQAWLRLAVPGVRVGTELPAADAALRSDGFIRTSLAGGDPGRFVPMRNPVIGVECWVAPDADSQETAWLQAAQLAERLLAATWDPALQGVVIDLSAFGSYIPARVHDVIAISEPDRNESDPTDWARYDLDLAFTWTTGA
jgi:hypothetical protein